MEVQTRAFALRVTGEILEPEVFLHFVSDGPRANLFCRAEAGLAVACECSGGRFSIAYRHPVT